MEGKIFFLLVSFPFFIDLSTLLFTDVDKFLYQWINFFCEVIILCYRHS